MTIGLTPRQAQLLAFIRAYVAKHHGVPPSTAEMMTELDLKSKSGISRMLGGLERRGYVCRIRYSHRSLTLVDPNDERPSDVPLTEYCYKTGLSRAFVIASALKQFYARYPDGKPWSNR